MRRNPKKNLLPIRVLFFSPGRIASSSILDMAFTQLYNQGAIEYRCIHENETSNSEQHEAIIWCDVAFFFRACFSQTVKMLRLAKSLGKSTIYSTDDDFLNLDKSSPLGKIHHLEENVSAFKSMMREADLLWLFTKEMVSRYESMNSKIVLGRLPSPIEYYSNNIIRTEDLSERLIIGYAGRFVHKKDLQIAIRPLCRLLDKYPTLELEFVDCLPEELCGNPRVKFTPYFDDIKNFYDYMSKANWAVGMALLEDTPFNRGKTNNKYREYGAFGIPGIYSDMPVYSSCIKNGINGFLAPHTEEGISKALISMIDDRDLRENIRYAALQDVSTRYSPKAMQQQLLREISLLSAEKLKSITASDTINILILGHDFASSTHIDALQPCLELKRMGFIKFTWNEPSDIKSEIDPYDCIYVVRAFELINHSIFQKAKHKNIPFIFSWDDDFFSLPKCSPNTSLAAYCSKPQIQKALRRMLRMCSLIITTTPQLTKRSRNYNSNIIEVIYGLRPPEMPIDEAIEKYETTSEPVKIGFFGSNNALEAPYIVKAVEKLRQVYKERICIEAIVVEISDSLKNTLNWYSAQALSYNESLLLLKSRNWDIGLAPLLDSEFNRAKQATKFRDYAWCGATIVASNVDTYRRVILNEIHGLLVENTPDEWYDGIVSLIENPYKRRFLADGAKQLLKNVHMQDETMASWYQILWRIMRNKEGFVKNLPKNNFIYSSSKDDINLLTKFIDTPKGMPISCITLDHRLRYSIKHFYPSWIGIDVMIGTHQKTISGSLILRVMTRNGQLLRKAEFDLSRAFDNDWISFSFHPIINSKGQQFLIDFTLQKNDRNTFISLYENNQAQNKYIMKISRRLRSISSSKIRNGLFCRKIY